MKQFSLRTHRVGALLLSLVSGCGSASAPPQAPVTRATLPGVEKPRGSVAAGSEASRTTGAGNAATASVAPATHREQRPDPIGEVHAAPSEAAADDMTFVRGDRALSREGAGSGISITLKNEFVETYKHRATLEATYTIDAASKVHPPKDDGEIHIAGRAPEIGLASVAEIMQAKSETTTIDEVRRLAGSGTTVSISGAWRIWCEHAGGGPQVQGDPLEASDTSNPDHVFEIHPVTQFGERSLAGTFISTAGYTPKDAETAFLAYEQVPSKITSDDQTTSIQTRVAGNNFVEFLLRKEGEAKDVDDGRFLMASALSLDGDLAVRNRRMVFVKGTPPYKASESLKVGECLRVIGIPRVDLAVVSWRTHHSAEHPEAGTWNLPYEIIVVASKSRAACES